MVGSKTFKIMSLPVLMNIPVVQVSVLLIN